MPKPKAAQGKASPLFRGIGYIPLGGKPRRPSEAWKKLSPQAKRLLQQMRQQGMFGGVPGTAPYWYSQEVGNAKAEIKAKRYIQKAVERWRPGLGTRLRNWLGR